jgi:hypothetical protein
MTGEGEWGTRDTGNDSGSVNGTIGRETQAMGADGNGGRGTWQREGNGNGHSSGQRRQVEERGEGTSGTEDRE